MSMVIESNDELIFNKLKQIKCEKCGNRIANYLVYQLGFYCSSCLASLKDIPKTHFSNFQQLSILLAKIVQKYKTCQQNGSNLLHLQVVIQNNDAANIRQRTKIHEDGRLLDTSVDEIFRTIGINCNNVSKNVALQKFGDYSTTILSLQDVLVENAKNLKAEQKNGLSYIFKEENEEPEQVKRIALKKIEGVRTIITRANEEAIKCMNQFNQLQKYE